MLPIENVLNNILQINIIRSKVQIDETKLYATMTTVLYGVYMVCCWYAAGTLMYRSVHNCCFSLVVRFRHI